MGGGYGKYVPPENYFLDNQNAEVLYKNFSFRIFENNFSFSKHSALGYFPSISKCGVCFAWPLMKESKDQASNGKCENAIKDELAGAHDKPKSQNIVRRKSNLPQVILNILRKLLLLGFEK